MTEGLTKNNIIHDAFWNYASVAVCGCVGLSLTIIIGAYYGPATLGAFNIVFAFYIIFSQVAAFGVHHSVLKHMAEFARDAMLRRLIFSYGLIITVPLALTVSLGLWVLHAPIARVMDSPDVAQGLIWATVGLFFFALNKVLLAALNAVSRLREYAVYMALRYVFMILGLLMMVATGQPGGNLAMILPAAEIALFCLLFWALLDEMQWGGWSALYQWSRQHLVFGLRGFGGNLLLDLNTRVDVLCLGLFVGDRAVGIYSMAAILAESAYQLPLVLRAVFNPRVIQLLAARTYGPLQALIRKTRLIVWAGMSLVAVIGTVIYPIMIPLVTGKPEYAEGSIYFMVIMVGMVIASGYMPFGLLLINAGRPGVQTFQIVLLLLLNVSGNLVFIPFLGCLGAALATAATHVFSLFLLRFFTRKYLKFGI